MKMELKHIVMQWIIACSVISLTACQEYTIDSQPEAEPTLVCDALDNYLVLASSPMTILFNISANTPWNISSNQQWCKVSPGMSASSSLVSEISVDCESNLTTNSRTAELTISAEGMTEKRVITITQASKSELSVIPYTNVIPKEGSTVTFQIISNKDWRIIPSAEFLSNIDKLSGTGCENETAPETVSITVPENSGTKRTGKITVKTDYDSYMFTLTQEGTTLEAILPEGGLKFSGAKESKTIRIVANIPYNVMVSTECEDWVSVNHNDVLGELEISVEQNPVFIERQGEVKLIPQNNIAGLDPVSVKFSQALQYTLSGKYTVASDGSIRVDGADGQIAQPNGKSFKKGHWTYEFKAIHLSKTSIIQFLMWHPKPNTDCNFFYQLTEDAENSKFQVGGRFGWMAKKFSMEGIENIKKVEIFLEDDPNNIGKLRMRLLLNGEEKGILEGRTNVYAGSDADEHVLQMFLKYLPNGGFAEGDYFELKSITFESNEE